MKRVEKQKNKVRDWKLLEVRQKRRTRKTLFIFW